MIELDEGKSCTGDVEDEAVQELADTPGITNGTKLSVLHELSSLVWSVVVVDRLPTPRNFRVLRRVFQAIRLQAYLLTIAQSRRAQDREQKPVVPHLFALLHWLSLPLWGFWLSAEFPVHPSSNPLLLSTCIESATNSRSSSNFELGAGVALISIGE